MSKCMAVAMDNDHLGVACNAMGEAEVKRILEELVAKARANGKRTVGTLKHESRHFFVYSLGKQSLVYVSVVTMPATLGEALAIHAGLVTTINGMK